MTYNDLPIPERKDRYLRVALKVHYMRAKTLEAKYQVQTLARKNYSVCLFWKNK